MPNVFSVSSGDAPPFFASSPDVAIETSIATGSFQCLADLLYEYSVVKPTALVVGYKTAKAVML